MSQSHRSDVQNVARILQHALCPQGTRGGPSHPCVMNEFTQEQADTGTEHYSQNKQPHSHRLDPDPYGKRRKRLQKIRSELKCVALMDARNQGCSTNTGFTIFLSSPLFH